MGGKMKKYIVITVVIIAGLFFWFKSHNSNKSQQAPTVSVKHGSIAQNAVAIGYIIPKHATTVKSAVDGIVGKTFHDAGDYVKADTPLLRITPDPKPTDVAKILSAISNDKAQLDSSSKQKNSFDKLLKQGIITKNYSQYLTTITQLKQSQAQLKFDQQQLDLMQKGEATIDGKQMRNTINSPIAGYILARDVDVGDPVVALGGATPATELFTIADMKNLIFQGDVDETDANRLHTGMPAKIEIAALPGKKIDGQLKLLSLQSEQQNTVTTDGPATSNASSVFSVGFQVRVEDLKLPTNVKLRSGYSATATINIKTLKNILVIPERVLVFKGEKTFVKIPQKHKPAKLVAIKTGISDGMNIQVLQGLTAGELLLDKASTENN
jgi:HlyD family secretion protein